MSPLIVLLKGQPTIFTVGPLTGLNEELCAMYNSIVRFVTHMLGVRVLCCQHLPVDHKGNLGKG